MSAFLHLLLRSMEQGVLLWAGGGPPGMAPLLCWECTQSSLPSWPHPRSVCCALPGAPLQPKPRTGHQALCESRCVRVHVSACMACACASPVAAQLLFLSSSSSSSSSQRAHRPLQAAFVLGACLVQARPAPQGGGPCGVSWACSRVRMMSLRAPLFPPSPARPLTCTARPSRSASSAPSRRPWRQRPRPHPLPPAALC